jgi:hypothetical protein
MGEFTVVIEIGHITDNVGGSDPDPADSRRQAVALVAKDHGLTANQLYRAIEELKKSVNRPT